MKLKTMLDRKNKSYRKRLALLYSYAL